MARLAPVIAFALALLALAAVPAPAAPPRTSLADLEGEVMCPVCGTLLELSSSPQGQRERAFIARLIAAGRTKAQIKEALVSQYGPSVLAVPQASGFNLSAYALPAVGFALAAVALGVGLMRWRRAGGGRRPPTAGVGPRGTDAERLDADLARYDL